MMGQAKSSINGAVIYREPATINTRAVTTIQSEKTIVLDGCEKLCSACGRMRALEDFDWRAMDRYTIRTQSRCNHCER